MYVCLWSPAWSTGGASGVEETAAAAAPFVAELAPRVRAERERIWADARGLDGGRLAERLVARLEDLGLSVRAGVAAVPAAAAMAARWGAYEKPEQSATPFLVKERTGWGWRSPTSGGGAGTGSPVSGGGEEGGKVVVVERGGERAWLAGLPVTALDPPDRLRPLLEGVGVDTVGELASLEREAVEVRFGAEAVTLWRLARADDRRLLFEPIPPERAHGSIDFVDYVLTDPSRLLFTANALLGPLCERLLARGEHARALRLTLPLGDGESWERTLRPARPTASRESWLRMIRGLFEELTVPDAVAGMRLEVASTEEAGVHQGDLFDRGFATASAVEAAVARLAERQLFPLVPEVDAHPLVERRSRWRTPEPGRMGPGRMEPERMASGSASGSASGGATTSTAVSHTQAAEGPGTELGLELGRGTGREPGPGPGLGLGLQLLPRPRSVVVETLRRRDHELPVRLRDRGGWREVLLAAGPDRISGGQWEGTAYAREYYRCITEEGVPLWIYRDGLDGRWYLHGWWD